MHCRSVVRFIWYFNPRTREGCDPVSTSNAFFIFPISIHAPVKGATVFLSLFLRDFTSISIHAPVKGATDVDVVKWYVPADFNPRTREGCDVAEQLQTNLSDTFQSTHP